MTRSELVDKLAIKKNISNAVAEKIITEIFKSMIDSLVSGNGVEIRGFGSFTVRDMTVTLHVIPRQVFSLRLLQRKLHSSRQVRILRNAYWRVACSLIHIFTIKGVPIWSSFFVLTVAGSMGYLLWESLMGW